MANLELGVEDLRAFVEKPIYTTEKDNLSALEHILAGESEDELYPGIPGFGQFHPVAPAIPEEEEEEKVEKVVGEEVEEEDSCEPQESDLEGREDVERIKVPLPPNLLIFNKEGNLSRREKSLFRYFRRRRIMDFFKFMMSHLLANQPENPLEFLRGLLDQCLLFRSGHADRAPLLFEDRNIDSIFRAMDPSLTGFISVEQYHTGMKTMGLKEYPMNPNVDENTGLVSHSEFFHNAKLSLVEDLLDMITVPPPPDPAENVEYAVYDTTVLARQKQMMNAETARRYIDSLMDWEQKNKVVNECFQVPTNMESLPPIIPQEKFGANFQPLKNIQSAYKPPK